MKIIRDVCGALIERNGKFLLAQRNPDDSFALKWEFPGGKVEEGETKEGCLAREILEEIDVEIEVGPLVNIFEDEKEDLKIIVYLYKCKISKGIARPIDCKDIRWVTLSEIGEMDLASADRKIFNWLKENG